MLSMSAFSRLIPVPIPIPPFFRVRPSSEQGPALVLRASMARGTCGLRPSGSGSTRQCRYPMSSRSPSRRFRRLWCKFNRNTLLFIIHTPSRSPSEIHVIHRI